MRVTCNTLLCDIPSKNLSIETNSMLLNKLIDHSCYIIAACAHGYICVVLAFIKAYLCSWALIHRAHTEICAGVFSKCIEIE